MARLFSSTSVETTLSSGISNSATSMTVASGTGSALTNGVTIGTGNQFTVAIDPDTTNEEIVFITAQSTDTFTITRARAGSSAVSHSAGATVRHVLTSDDLDYFNTAIQPSIVDAKGDLIVATASDTVSRLASSATNNDLLTVDTSTATGLKWMASSTVGSNYAYGLKTPTGRYLMSYSYGFDNVSSTSFLTPTVDLTYFVPFYVPVTTTFDRLAMTAVNSSAVNTASFTIRLGIYNQSNGLPSTVLLDAGTVVASMTANQSNTQYDLTINQSISPGIYFFALNCQAKTGTPVVGAYNPVDSMTLYMLHTSTLVTNLDAFRSPLGVTQSATVTSGFATAGSSFSYLETTATSSRCPLIGMRAS